MVKADYWGTGETFTKDGTPIFFSDKYGINRGDAPENMIFEAAWDSAGAIFAERPRFQKLLKRPQTFPIKSSGEKQGLIVNYSIPQ